MREFGTSTHTHFTSEETDTLKFGRHGQGCTRAHDSQFSASLSWPVSYRVEIGGKL